MKKSKKADIMLLLVTLGWGLSYYFADVAMTELNVFTQNAFRFITAFALAFLLSRKKLMGPGKKTMVYSLLCGGVLFFVYVGATMGVKYTTLSNTGFLCSLTVIFTPILSFLYYRIVPGRKTFFSVALCFLGISLLTLDESFSINMKNLKGDLYSILCALAYAHHLLLTERAVRDPGVDAYQLSVYQFSVCGVLNLLMAFVLENPSLPHTRRVWFAILFLSVVCTGLAFIIQTAAQRHTEATHVGIIFSLEPVFAAIAAYFLAGDRLTGRAYFGALLMVASIFLMELPVEKFIRKEA